MFSSPHRLRGIALVAALGIGSLLTACGSDATDGTSDTTEGTGTPEDVKLPIDEVLAKLPDILTRGDAAAAAADEGDFDVVLAEFDELHEVWEDVEGAILDADADVYEAIETAQGLIKDGGETENAERVALGVADQADAIGIFVEGNS